MSRELFTVALEEHFATAAILARTAHLKAPEFLEPGGARYSQLVDLGEVRLAAMDACGIDVQVLSHTAPGLEHVAGADAPALAREANDLALDLIQRHPTRFQAFATLPTSDPGSCADELNRAVGSGFVGALINGSVNGKFLDHPEFDDLLTAAEELDVPIYVHPGLPPVAVTQAYYSGFAPAVTAMLSTSAWGWHAETALHVLRLALSGAFDRHPRLQIIIGHMGEMLPVMLDRASLLLTPLAGLQRPVREYLTEHVHITVAGVYSQPAFLACLQTWGISRLMFSTDYPYVPGAAAFAFLRDVALSPQDRRRLAGLNAASLLRLDIPTP